MMLAAGQMGILAGDQVTSEDSQMGRLAYD